MVIELVAEIFDKGVMRGVEEIVRCGASVMLLRVDQRAAILLCQASTILPLGTTLVAVRAPNTNPTRPAVGM